MVISLPINLRGNANSIETTTKPMPALLNNETSSYTTMTAAKPLPALLSNDISRTMTPAALKCQQPGILHASNDSRN
jgi:hypothetical protein